MNKPLSSVNFSLELEYDTSGTIFCILPSYHLTWEINTASLEDSHTVVQNWHLYLQAFCKNILDVRKINFEFHLFVKGAISGLVSSRLARKSPANSWFPSEKAMFVWSDLRSDISNKTMRISTRIVFPDQLSVLRFYVLCKKQEVYPIL